MQEYKQYKYVRIYFANNFSSFVNVILCSLYFQFVNIFSRFYNIVAAFRIHLILTWILIRILGSTFGKSGSRSGSSDPHLEKVDPDPVPKSIRIRIRVPIFHIFHKEIHVGQIKMLIFITAKIQKRHFSDNKNIQFYFYSTQFWCYPDLNQCFVK